MVELPFEWGTFSLQFVLKTAMSHCPPERPLASLKMQASVSKTFKALKQHIIVIKLEQESLFKWVMQKS